MSETNPLSALALNLIPPAIVHVDDKLVGLGACIEVQQVAKRSKCSEEEVRTYVNMYLIPGEIARWEGPDGFLLQGEEAEEWKERLGLSS